jgi:phenylalanyl-tRNA synthetase alpha chain
MSALPERKEPAMRPLTTDELKHALRIRDLTDPAAGPHAIQLVVDRLEAAVAGGAPIRRYRGDRVVEIADNYDRLRYRADDVTRDSRYTRYVDGSRMLRSHTTAHVPGLLRELMGARQASAPKLASDGPDQVLLSIPGVCYRRDVIDRRHVGEPHQLDLWLVRRHGPALGQQDLVEMIGAVVDTVRPGATPSTPDSAHPYPRQGREIYVDGVEIGECGLAHPEVLGRAGLGRDASGLAMGLGLDRLTMLVKGIDDIRLLRASDPRVASQMTDLEPYRPVSGQPPIRRDLSLALDAAPDGELLGDRIREILGDRASVVEAVEIGPAIPHADLPETARVRMGMRPGQINVLVRVTLRDHDRTLTDDDANAIRDELYRGLHRGRDGEWHSSRAAGASYLDV